MTTLTQDVDTFGEVLLDALRLQIMCARVRNIADVEDDGDFLEETAKAYKAVEKHLKAIHFWVDKLESYEEERQ